jgi:hypothetical protein
MPQLILTTKKGREIVHAFQNEDTLNNAIQRIREVMSEDESTGIDIVYKDLLGKMRTLLISRKFLKRVTISTL